MSSNSPAGRRPRREVLVNGRRVRISDLINAELLQKGSELFYRQHIGSAPHRAVVTERGRLRLADGREFDSPSGAATAAAEVTAVPGWEVWRVGTDGPYLRELRLELLRTVADEVTADQRGPEVEAVQRRFTKLEDARRDAEAGRPRTMTVRELLEEWGFEDRDAAVNSQIVEDLANHGLVTVPDFRAVSLDEPVRIVQVGVDQGSTVERPTDVPEEATGGVGESTGDSIAVTLGNLLPKPEDRRLVSVSPTSTFTDAITAMELDDYSQLPVLANPYTLHGVVSWKSIAKAQFQNRDASFSDAIDTDTSVFDYGRRLIDAIPTLLDKEFIFVRNHERKVAGIITATDVVKKYDELATHILLIGEIEHELRQLIRDAFDDQVVEAACTAAGLAPSPIGEMSISHYQAILGKCWDQLGWSLDRKRVIKRLDDIRKIRNRVAHFKNDSIKPDEVEMLRHFLDMIRRYNA
jgi:CBS domain-containing protein